MECLCWLVYLPLVELARSAAPNQFGCILKSCWPVEAVLKAFPTSVWEDELLPHSPSWMLANISPPSS